jgi:hypothetical protein
MADTKSGGDTPPDSGTLVRLADFRKDRQELPVTFNRRELDQILRLYGFMVGAGEWRDYAIDHLRDQAIFSAYRRSSEAPMFQIIKSPKLARKQGEYSVVNTAGMVLKRGHDLERVLRVFDKSLGVVRA